MCKENLAKKIDYQVFPGLQGAPKMDMIAARAVQALESMSQEYIAYQHQVQKNAQVLAAELLNSGFRLVSGGTDTHLVLVDVRNFIPSGKEAELVLESVGIIVNKNLIPFDPQEPKVTSGIRIGSPELTTRGLDEASFRKVAALLTKTLQNYNKPDVLDSIKKEVRQITKQYPLFADKWLAK